MNVKVLMVLISLILGKSTLQAQEENKKPNVIIIMADDMGYGDMGYHKNPMIDTPVLDSFAKESIQFSNFYVSPVCAPTRASLLTGRYNIRTGVYDTFSGGAIMASNEITIAEIFKDNGYKTGLFGKWHLGDSYPSRPQDQGFSDSVWHLSGGIGQVGDVFNYYKRDSSYFNPVLFKNGKKHQSKGYCTDVFTNEAISFIKNSQDQPFLAYISYNAPHTPLQVPQEYLDKYKDKKIDEKYFQSKGIYTHKMSDSDISAAKKVYAMVDNIDVNIGHLITVLKEQGIYENTIIIFLTDNGPEQHRYTGGYRGKKGLVQEGGIHVPFYLKLNKKETTAVKIKIPSAHIDVLPTLAELCNIKIPSNLNIDGVSLAGVINKQQEDIKSRPLFFEWNRSYPEKYRNMAVIYKGYKLIGNMGQNSLLNEFELYNLQKDPFESNNIIAQNLQRAKSLKTELDTWYSSIMQSKNILQSPKIIIDSEKEPIAILNRNDAKGLPLIWDSENVHVSWDLHIKIKDTYKIVCYFRNPIPKPGNMIIRFGVQNITKKITKTTTKSVTFSNVILEKGDTMLDAWFSCGWADYYTPFYIEISKQNHI